MNPGLLNRRLTLQSRTVTIDGAGGRVEAWADEGKMWAQEVNQSQRESIVSDAERNVESRVFRARWNPSISSEGYRIIYQGRKYNITGISEEGVKDMMLLNCEASRNLDL